MTGFSRMFTVLQASSSASNYRASTVRNLIPTGVFQSACAADVPLTEFVPVCVCLFLRVFLVDMPNRTLRPTRDHMRRCPWAKS